MEKCSYHFGEKRTNRYAMMTALPKEKLYFRNGSNFPNPILAVSLIHRLRINGICYAISIFELEFSTGRWTPRQSILSLTGIRHRGGFHSNKTGLGRTKDSPSQFRPKKPATSFSLISSSPLFSGPKMQLLRASVSNHLSNQRERPLLLPATHLAPLLTVASPNLLPVQVGEQEVVLSKFGGLLLSSVLFRENSNPQRCFFSFKPPI